MDTYGLGGNEVKLDASEAIAEIPQNKTLLIEKLTASAPVKPQVVKGLKTIEDVFVHFQPKVDLQFEDAEGTEKKETLSFKHLGDFGLKGVTNQSEFLSDLTTEKDQYQKIMKALKTNKVLRAALADPASKAAVINAIKGLINELEQTQ